jgi:hypothetical protein
MARVSGRHLPVVVIPAGGVGFHIARFVFGSALRAMPKLMSAATDGRFLRFALTDERKIH